VVHTTEIVCFSPYLMSTFIAIHLTICLSKGNFICSLNPSNHEKTSIAGKIRYSFVDYYSLYCPSYDNRGNHPVACIRSAEFHHTLQAPPSSFTLNSHRIESVLIWFALVDWWEGNLWKYGLRLPKGPTIHRLSSSR